MNADIKLKIELLLHGARVTPAFARAVAAMGKSPAVARTGLANGLEVILNGGTWVNIQLRDDAPFILDVAEKTILVVREGSIERCLALAPRPKWHSAKLPDGKPATTIGMLRGDRLGVTLLKDCAYFDNATQCHFCAIKFNPSGELREKRANDIAYVATLAMDDPAAQAKHIYFNLGNTYNADRGLKDYEEIMVTLRRVTAAPVHLNQTAPPRSEYIKILHDLGFDEISFNIEFVNSDVSRRLMPGKFADVSLNHCLDMLVAAVEVFGYPNVSSSVIVGIEDVLDTLVGVEELMRRRVIPKLSIFRPLRGSQLANHTPPSAALLRRLYEEASNLSAKYSVPLGPLCDPCKMLSLVD